MKTHSTDEDIKQLEDEVNDIAQMRFREEAYDKCERCPHPEKCNGECDNDKMRGECHE